MQLDHTDAILAVELEHYLLPPGGKWKINCLLSTACYPAEGSEFCHLLLSEHTPCFRGVVWAIGVWLKQVGKYQKVFSYIFPSPDPLTRGNRLYLEIFPPVPIDNCMLEVSAAPCLGYMGSNKENHRCIISTSLSSYVCLLFNI